MATASKSRRTHITITRRGQIHPHVRLGAFTFEGGYALAVIAIILAVRIVRDLVDTFLPILAKIDFFAGRLLVNLALRAWLYLERDYDV